MKDLSKEHKILLFIVLLLAIGVGYAFLTVNLKINGTASITDGRWNIHFENYQETANSTISPTSGNVPVITGDTTTEISYTVTFQQPGDVYEFTIDLVNGGTMDASVISMDKSVSIGNSPQDDVPAYLDYSVTYSNGDPYTIPHTLAVDGTDSILVRVEFKRDITVSQLNEVSGRTLRFSLTPICEQDSNDGSGYTYLYTMSSYHVGESVRVNSYTFHGYLDPNYRIYLRLKVIGGIIDSIDIVYHYNSNYYYIPSYEIGNSEQFHETATVLQSIFGEDSCEYTTGYKLVCPGIEFSRSEPLELSYGNHHCTLDGEYGSCS